MSAPTPGDPGGSEGLYRLLVESVVDYAIFVLDPTGRVASWNPGAERIKGYTEEEILGTHFSAFYPEAERQRRFPEHELEVATRTGRYEDEGWRVKKDGSQFWANVVITALRDDAGRLVGFAKVTRDLTHRVQADAERRALESERRARIAAEELTQEVTAQAARLEEQAAELEMLNDELQSLAAQLSARSEEAERAQAQAEAASRAKSDFLASMSHELRTPINAILGYADLMEMGLAGPLSDPQVQYLERIRTSGRHLLGLIEEILDLSKVEAGRVDIHEEPADLGVAVEAALALVAPQAANARIELLSDCDPTLGRRFVGDEHRVRQILLNLLSNAVKFTEPGGRVSVLCGRSGAPGPGEHLRDAGPWLRVAVEDTGIGIPRERLESVFEPFVQVESGHTRSRGGTGLGLAISRRLARLMGGDIVAESEVGQGSRFELWLPEERRAELRREPLVDELLTAGAPPAALAHVGSVIKINAEAIVAAVNRRLRVDPALPAAGLTEAELDDHQPAFLSALGQLLEVLGDPSASEDLVRESFEVQRLLASRHGKQRFRLDWPLAALEGESAVLREETARVLDVSPADAPAEPVFQILHRVLAAAGAASREGWEEAASPGVQAAPKPNR